MIRKTRQPTREQRRILRRQTWRTALCAVLCCLIGLFVMPAWGAEGREGPQEVYHSPTHLYYQASSHTVAYGPKTFVLIPQEEYSETWTPSTVEWSGKANANYRVVYCSDDRTSSTTQGASYATFTLDDSRFTDDVQRRKLAAIIGHSYPFLTAEEMRQTLQQAVMAGEVMQEVLDCTESEWIAAAQWAIWSTTATTGQIEVEDVGGADFPEGHPEKYIHPLSDVGHTDETQIKTHIEALKNWLCSLEEPAALEMEAYTHAFAKNSDGTYRLEVVVQLNRAVTAREKAAYQLQVGGQAAQLQQIAAGEDTFTAALDSIPYEALADARVQLTLTGQHMQAYFYDSENYQDMVGGSWEDYRRDLSFGLGMEEIDISVAKVWSQQDTVAPSVTVQLYANGKPHGAAVSLTEEGNWSYVWRGLYRTDILGQEIAYTVQETPMDGYYSRLEQVDAYSEAVQLWEEVPTFTGEGSYLIVSSFGALAATEYTDEAGADKDDYVTLKAVDVTSVKKTPAGAVWKAVATDEEGAFALYTPHLDWYMYMSSYGCLSATSCPLRFEDGHLYRLNSSGEKRYFAGFYSDEAFYVSGDETRAMDFKLYKLVEKPLPAADISFLLTNTRYDLLPDGKVRDITVEKQWAGREDGKYPASVTVTLLQNGRPYGQPVVLSAENQWKHTWINMPVQVGEETITYTVEESLVEGYELLVQEQDYAYTLTNTWKGEGEPEPKPEQEEPKLPQTGQRRWLVGLALASGVVLTAAGWIHRKKHE